MSKQKHAHARMSVSSRWRTRSVAAVPPEGRAFSRAVLGVGLEEEGARPTATRRLEEEVMDMLFSVGTSGLPVASSHRYHDRKRNGSESESESAAEAIVPGWRILFMPRGC